MAVGVREVAVGVTESATTVQTSASVEAGDLLLATQAVDFDATGDQQAPTTDTAEWTHVVTGESGRDDDPSIKVWRREVTAGGVQTVTFAATPSGGSNHVRVRVLTGVDLTNPVDDSAGTASLLFGADQVAPSVSPSTSDALLCCDWCQNDSDGYVAPGGMTGEAETDSGFSTAFGARETLSSSGATGTRTATGQAAVWVATSVGFRAAADDEPAEGTATLGLGLALSASGSRDSAGTSTASLGLSLAASGSRPSAGAGGLGIGLTLAASGSRPSTGTAAFQLGLRLTAAGPVSQIEPAPPEQTWSIPAESRTVTPAGGLTHAVEEEVRRVSVPA